jgi:hypothetical protein
MAAQVLATLAAVSVGTVTYILMPNDSDSRPVATMLLGAADVFCIVALALLFVQTHRMNRPT